MPSKPISIIAIWSFVGALIFLAILLRFLFLSSDPYSGLDWSTGLLTDESFYSHNARNLVLFGRARMDEFNNMLLSPLIHLKQWMVFSVIGVGFVQARIMAALTSLIALALFFAALNRAFGFRVAALGALFLGFDHTYLLYSRMSLLDSYAVLPCIAAFYCFVLGIQANTKSRALWLGACGAALAIAVTNRSLCIYLLPVPSIAMWHQRTKTRDLVSVGAGLCGIAILYFFSWYWPNRVEIGAMAHYYRTVQLQPKSTVHLLSTLYHNLLGDTRGVSSYLLRHTPVLFSFALIGLLAGFSAEGAPQASNTPDSSNEVSVRAIRYLAAWLILGWAMLFVLGYSPSRYYVTTYPALFAFAAVTISRFAEMWVTIRAKEYRIPLVALIWFLTYHLVQSMIHRGGVMDETLSQILLYTVPTMAAGTAFSKFGTDRRYGLGAVRWAIGLWAAVNIAWMGHWLGTMRWTQADFSGWMRQNLPSRSVAVGDVAAGLGLGHPFHAINVIPGLCNDRNPLEGFTGGPKYIVILDGQFKERYWRNRYPELVSARAATYRTTVLKWDVGVYSGDRSARLHSRSGFE